MNFKNNMFFLATIWIINPGLAGLGYATPVKIRICKIADHPALDATTQGITETLRKNGYQDIKIESAQGSPALAGQIASRLNSEARGGQHKLISVAIGTIAAQSLAKYARKKAFPLIFSSITDPQGAGLTKYPSGCILKGVSNFVPIEPQLKKFQSIQPTLKRLTLIYNPGESNSVFLLKEVQRACTKMGMVLTKKTLMKTSDAMQVVKQVAPSTDAFFITNDNTALSALPAIVKAAGDIPVYISDTDALKPSGAVAAFGPDQYDLGVQTAHMVLSLLTEKKGSPTDPLIELPKKTEFVINHASALKKKGIVLLAPSAPYTAIKLKK